MFGNERTIARLHARKEAVLRRTKQSDAGRSRWQMSRKVRITAGLAAVLGLFGTGLVTGAGVNAAPGPVGQGFTVTKSDLAFILKQIKIAERHSRSLAGAEPTQGANPNVAGDPQYCSSLVGPNPDQIPDYLTSYGLRTVDGGCNNLVPAVLTNPDGSTALHQTGTPVPVLRTVMGSADQPFPRLTNPVFRDAEVVPAGFPSAGQPSSYTQKLAGNVVADTQPRLISNLIVDQTSTNPAAVHAAGFPVRTQGNPGIVPCLTDGTGADIIPPTPANCVPAHSTLFIPNVTTDVGLSPPYNSLFTFFGQFFDHGVDQTVKSGGTVFVPLRPDDPLIAGPDHIVGNADDLPVGLRFMAITRGQNQPGVDGILGTADDIQNANNTDSPWVDQSQTYTSHSSHQAFLREYVPGPGGPVATGKLLGGLAAGQTYLDSPDGQDGIGTWAAVKKQAAEVLGLQLVDTDVTNIPMLAADPYGNFIRGANGLPQYVTTTGLVEGNLASPVLVPANVLHFDTPFLTDIAHNADPSGGLTPDGDNTPSADFKAQPAGTYDDELLNAHFACGDGRCNENIALSTIHQIFHSEHDRLVDYNNNVIVNDPALNTDYHDTNCAVGCLTNNPALPTTYSYGERLFQTARFVTEMEYQHLVFEEFARKMQPAIRPFHVYNADINAAIPAEFAHAVYRFGHSMLDDDVARINTDPTTGALTDNSVPLLTAFLNPPEFFNSHSVSVGVLTPKQAAGSIVMGSSDQVGNELDEFVTETLRNNLLGLPLDLPVLNMTRARSEGIPPLNDVRRQLFARTNDGQVAPYKSWSDFGQNIKHPESLINFVAAYGTHPTIRDSGPDGILGTADDVTTIAAKRAAATLIVNPTNPLDPAIPTDAADFMFSTGAWVSDLLTGVTTTGLDSVDLWVGGLAEITNLFGGLLGSTFNAVFQLSLENLQEGDRLYYLARTPGMNLRTQLEGNSFAELIMRNTDNTNTLKADAFATADCKFQLGHLTFPAPVGSFITGAGSVADDPLTTDCDENRLLLQKPDGTIQYRQVNSVDPTGINGQSVYNGTPGVDRIWGGNDNDTFWGGPGNDIIEGNGGDDVALGGEGNDIITDLSGFDTLKGGPGNDALDGGLLDDNVFGGDGSDVLNGGANDNFVLGGEGNDFIIGGQGADVVQGDAGDDWIQGGSGQDLLEGDHGAPFFDDPSQTAPGNDVFVGQVGENDYDAEGGDDLMAQNPAIDRNAGAAGFDWAFHQYDTVGADDDMNINNNLVGVPIQVVVNRDRWQETEADSGSAFNDLIKGTDRAPSTIGGAGFVGCDALDAAGVARIEGLNALVTTFPSPLAPIVAASVAGRCPLNGGTGTGTVWGEGDILTGGLGSDTIEGRGANDIIDGDRTLQVRIGVKDALGAEIGSTDLLEHKALTGNFGPGTNANMTLQQAVFAGLVDPGNMFIGRRLVLPAVTAADCAAGAAALNCDSAVFSGPSGNYSVVHNADGSVTVTDNVGTDGIDTLWNMEQASFCTTPGAVRGTCLLRETVPLVGVPTPTALLSVSSLSFAVLRAIGAAATTLPLGLSNTGTANLVVSPFSITGTNPTSFSATSNCITVLPGGGCSFTVSFTATVAGLNSATLNIPTNAGTLAVPLSGTGVVNTPAVGVPAISDTTPTQGTAITASTAGITDVDGVPAVLSFVWRQNLTPNGAVNTVIAGATTPSFTPGALQVNRRLTVTVSFVDNAGSLETTVSAITTVVGELFNGTAGVDVKTGTAGQDEYHGLGANDNLATGAEDDIVSGDAGDDTVATAAGDDLITFSGTGEGSDAVTGGAGVDAIVALVDGTAIGLRSISTVETISANGHTGVTILGSAGNDVLNFTAVTLVNIVSIDGGGGNDSITGSAAADVIIGRAGTDTLNGGIGTDILEGGANNDTMNGGANDDVFRYTAAFGADTITGFDANPTGGQDLIDLRGLGITAATFAANVTHTAGSNTVITIAGQGTIRLSGVNGPAIDASDFILAP